MRNELSEIKETVQGLFSPSAAQKKAKANLMVALEDEPFEKAKLSCQQCISLSGCIEIGEWWKIKGFKEWLLNDREHRQRLEYLYSAGLDALEEVMQTQDRKSQGARIAAVKLLVELADKMPQKVTKIEVADKKISNMGREELLEYIKANQAKVLSSTPPALSSQSPSSVDAELVPEAHKSEEK